MHNTLCESRPTVPDGEIERAEPDTELHCSSVLRPYAETTRLREGFLLRLACGGQAGGQAGDSERGRVTPSAAAASAGLV